MQRTYQTFLSCKNRVLPVGLFDFLQSLVSLFLFGPWLTLFTNSPTSQATGPLKVCYTETTSDLHLVSLVSISFTLSVVVTLTFAFAAPLVCTIASTSSVLFQAIRAPRKSAELLKSHNWDFLTLGGKNQAS